MMRGLSWLEEHTPLVAERGRALRLVMHDLDSRVALREAVKRADLVLFSGAGGWTDMFPFYTTVMLDALEVALTAKRPIVMLSQGMGPVERPELRARMQRDLRRVKLIAVRDPGATVALLKEMGIANERIVLGADDAVALVFPNYAEGSRSSIGFNIRVGTYAGVERCLIPAIGKVLRNLAAKHGATLLPIPIAYGGAIPDGQACEEVLQARKGDRVVPESAPAPVEVIRQVGACRVVVTGAYHAAVFALAQGIPAVCVVGSPYFANKFGGLAVLFGDGCRNISVVDDDFETRLYEAADWGWAESGTLRQGLLDRSESLARTVVTVYDRLPSLLAAEGKQN
jgi:colanic acid/amylovoran biosynthesis protein